jgi:transcriptional regulator with XRE-family HTH domain
MSQNRFADYLGIGVASLKRWESGEIQTQQMDRFVRLRTDVEVAEAALQELYELEASSARAAGDLGITVDRNRWAQALHRKQRAHTQLRVVASKGHGLAA